MLSFNVDVELVDGDGETIWTQLIVAPENGAEAIDLKLPDDIVVPSDGIIMVKPRELIRALELALAERGENADRTPESTQEPSCCPDLDG